MSYNCGIYFIINKTNQYFYIGSSSNLSRRWQDHKKLLRKNKHYNSYLQNAWNKYGEPAFTFKHILYCEKLNLLFYEQRFLNKYIPRRECYNLSKDVNNSMLGRKHSEESKRKMSAAHRGIGGYWKGKKMSLESREKMRKNNLGKKLSNTTKLKLRTASTGRIFSLERKRKISESKLGTKNTQAKLTEKDVIDVRNKLTLGVKARQLAILYNVSETTISQIRSRKVWGHI